MPLLWYRLDLLRNVTKGGAYNQLDFFVQLVEGAGWQQEGGGKTLLFSEKLVTLRDQSRYLLNSDHCIIQTSCSSLHAWSWSRNWGQSLKNLTLTELSKFSIFVAVDFSQQKAKLWELVWVTCRTRDHCIKWTMLDLDLKIRVNPLKTWPWPSF